VHRAPEKHVQGLAILFGGHRVHWTDSNCPGVIHQDIDGPKLAAHVGQSPFYLVTIANVAWANEYLPFATQKLVCALQAIGIPSQQRHSRSSLQESAGERQTESARATRNHHRSSQELVTPEMPRSYVEEPERSKSSESDAGPS
jgi:hypothetical protein